MRLENKKALITGALRGIGKVIADLFIAVNRRRGSAYIPVVLWGGNAIKIKDLNTGDKIRLDGRFQSREFIKVTDGEAVCYFFAPLSNGARGRLINA